MNIHDIIRRITQQANRLSARRMQPGIVVMGSDTALCLRQYNEQYNIKSKAVGSGTCIMGIRCITSRDVPDDFVGVYGDVP